MQLRFETTLTSEQYVSEKAWRHARLDRCPLHPDGGCGYKRHGSYERQQPPGARVARSYCPRGRTTFSLLPDCLAAKLPGTLAEVEQVVSTVEQAPSVEAAADRLRPDIELPGRLRWVRRRRQLVHAALAALFVLLPDVLGGCEPTLCLVRSHLDTDLVLPVLRKLGEPYLRELAPPLGFGPRIAPSGQGRQRQHDSGPRAPPAGC